ncbi:hypothetical protein AAF712_004417 [Marasmius tenuissimus]|uniref:Mating-type protein C-terminal domain-containing protein n=1 Tax=Marasmius tenuissimus TaxID=585030 RepID=A0ABR3A404_9AGAR
MDLESRLCSALDDYIDTIGTPSFEEFVGRMNLLEQEIINSPPSSLEEGTCILAAKVSDCLADLCDAFMDLNRIDDTFKSRIGGLMSSDIPNVCEQDEERQTSTPSYAKAAHAWLLDNLHNPFPSRQTWFNEMRKKIGWNAIKTAHYKSRKEMTDAATYYFLDDKPTDSRPLPNEIEKKFITMEAKAKDLYTKRFAPSELMRKLDGNVKTMSSEVKQQADAERRERQKEKRRVGYIRGDMDKAAPFEFRPTGTIQEMAQAAETNSTTTVAGRKRRSGEEEEEPLRKRKRHYHDDDDEDASSVASSSRRASSLFSDNESTTATDLTTPASSPSPCSSSSPLPSHEESSTTPRRKRRLSESDGSQPRAPKRARHQIAGRATSAPAAPMNLPSLPFAPEDWFNKVPPSTEQSTLFNLDNTEYSLDINRWLANLSDFSDGESSGSSSGVATPSDQTTSLPQIATPTPSDVDIMQLIQTLADANQSSFNVPDPLYNVDAPTDLTVTADFATQYLNGDLFAWNAVTWDRWMAMCR